MEKSLDSASLKRQRHLNEVLGVILTSIIGEDDAYIVLNFHQKGEQASAVFHYSRLSEN